MLHQARTSTAVPLQNTGVYLDHESAMQIEHMISPNTVKKSVNTTMHSSLKKSLMQSPADTMINTSKEVKRMFNAEDLR